MRAFAFFFFSLLISPCFADEVPIGGAITGELSSADAERAGRYVEDHNLALEADQIARVTVNSASFDAYLEATTPEGIELSDDDSGGGTNARLLVHSTNGGDAQLTVTSFDFEATGAFTVSAEAVSAETLTLGETHEAVLGEEATDFYLLPINEEAAVVIEARSDEFDPVLTIHDPAGHRRVGDDTGDSLHATVEVPASDPGTALVQVRAFAGEASGEYTVRSYVSPEAD